MATTQVKRRRGTAAQCDAMTPAEGEIIYDTTNDRLRVGDGAVAGGFALPNAFDIQKGAFNTVNASGTDTLTVTLDPVPASYTTNMTVHFKAAATNTGAATLNVNSLGAKNIYKASGGALVALGAGDLTIGAFYTVRYDGTQFVLEGAAGGGVTSTAAADASLVVTPTTGAATAKINTNNSLGVGAYAVLCYVGSGNLANGATTSGSNLEIPIMTWGTGSSVTRGLSSPSGTWRNVSGRTMPTAGSTGELGLFIRTA